MSTEQEAFEDLKQTLLRSLSKNEFIVLDMTFGLSTGVPVPGKDIAESGIGLDEVGVSRSKLAALKKLRENHDLCEAIVSYIRKMGGRMPSSLNGGGAIGKRA